MTSYQRLDYPMNPIQEFEHLDDFNHRYDSEIIVDQVSSVSGFRIRSQILCTSTNEKEKAIDRHILVSHFNHLATLAWARLILGRFRDA